MANFGTAPRKVNGVWVTQHGRRLSDAGQTYWENQHRLGLADARGHYRHPSALPPSPPAPPSRPSRPLPPPPSRPPDTRRDVGLPTTGQRLQQTRDSTAYDLANRVFNASRRYFGPKTQMPLIYWRSHTPGKSPAIDLERAPAVPLAQALSRHGYAGGPVGYIAYPYARSPITDKAGQQWFADILLHELSHTQQTLDAQRGRNFDEEHLKVEGGADAFARLVRAHVFAQAGLGNPLFPYTSGYGNLGRQYQHRYGAPQALYGQFGQQG